MNEALILVIIAMHLFCLGGIVRCLYVAKMKNKNPWKLTWGEFFGLD